jgi:predicted Zn-dependent protease
MKTMKTPLACLVLAGLVAAGIAGCRTNPYTGREQLMLVSKQQAVQMGSQANQQIVKKENLSNDPRYVNPVRRIGGRIAAQIEQVDYDWRFNVVDDPDTLNAFALPGGYVYVYTGLIDLAQGDAELASVIAHEIAHVIARHGSERMSMQMVSQLGQQLAATALGSGSSAGARAAMVAFGAGAKVGVILPYSRKHEHEADIIGLKLMAAAGYDPREAVDFWKRMAAQSKGGKPPAFLSTHPTDEARIESLKRNMPEAMDIYWETVKG